MHSLDHRIPPPLVAAGVAVLMWCLSRLMPSWDFLLPQRSAIAAAIALMGLLVSVAGVVEFRKARTTANPLKPADASALVRTGIFRYTRNPMYLGMLLVLLGYAAYLGNLLALAGLPVFVGYMNRFQIRSEETVLETLFGPSFAEYRKTVRRWL